MSLLGRNARSIVVGSLLLIGSAGLAAANWWLATAPVDLNTVTSGSSKFMPPHGQMPGLLPHVQSSDVGGSSLSAALARPVFSPTRRPPKHLVKKVHHQPVVTAPAPSVPAPRLIAVAISGSRRAALFSDPQLPDGQWLNEGMQAHGWTLRSIDADRAVVQSGNQTVTLQLYEAEGMPPSR